MLCTVLGTVFGVLVALYGLFELHYFLRMCLCVVSARFLKKRMHILDTSSVVGEYGQSNGGARHALKLAPHISPLQG